MSVVSLHSCKTSSPFRFIADSTLFATALITKQNALVVVFGYSYISRLWIWYIAVDICFILQYILVCNSPHATHNVEEFPSLEQSPQVSEVM